MVNVPWVFNACWVFIKGLLDEQYVTPCLPLYLSIFIYDAVLHRTVAKISMSSSGHCLDTLLKDVPLESIPTSLGGSFALFNEPFHFDLSSEGPFYLEGHSAGVVTQALDRLSLKVGDNSTILSTGGVASDSSACVVTKEKEDKLSESYDTVSNTSGSCYSDHDHC